MTHDHDLELIAAIAEGDLSPAAQATAEASLASCAACRVNLELQREALAVLRNASVVAMTDLERARLHRGVDAGIAPPLAEPTAPPSVPWFQRLIPAMAAAAALLVVVGVGSVLISNDAGDLDAAPETTAVASESPRVEADEEFSESAGGLESDDLADATTTAPAVAQTPAESLVESLGDLSKTELRAAALQLTAEPADGGADARNNLELMAFGADLICLEAAAAEGEIAAIRRATVDDVELEIYLIDDRVDVYARPDCSLFDSFE